MIKRKFAGKQSLFDALFPYIESEAKRRVVLQSSSSNVYNEGKPTLGICATSHEEDSQS
jgi:hypothetical protein